MSSLFSTFMKTAMESNKAIVVIRDKTIRCSVNLNLSSAELDEGDLILGDDDQQVIITNVEDCSIEELGDDFMLSNEKDNFLAIITLY